MRIHINRGTGRYYIARHRRRGGRKFIVLKRRYKTKEAAARALLKAMLEMQARYHGQVCLCADYYEPLPVLEIKGL